MTSDPAASHNAPPDPAAPIPQQISVEEYESLKQAYESLGRMFEDFRTMSEQVERAYSSLQVAFEKVNLELERKNAELRDSLAKREALEREVVQAKTLAALGEMSATVAHEIRNPLGAMGVWAELLERELDPQDPRRKRLTKITDGLAKLNKIVSNLLVYTRPMTSEFRRVRLDALLEEIVDFTEIEIERLGRNVAVVKDFADSPGIYVKADPEKIHQATINLCLNAVQAMEDGGTLKVSLGRGGENGKSAVFTVTDTGSGIDREHLAKIFDPFFTTKEDGTGLGLAIVRKIIESHGGTIDVKSEIGAGTRVSCFLPTAE